MAPRPAVNVRFSPPPEPSIVPPKEIFPVVTIIELSVSVVAAGPPVTLNEAALIVVAPPVPDCVLSANVSELETNRAPVIRPLAWIVASVTFPEPVKDKLTKLKPPLLDKSPIRVIAPLVPEVTRERLVPAVLAEIPPTVPVALSTMLPPTPATPVAVRVMVPGPPPT